MPQVRTPIEIKLTQEEQAELERITRSHTAQHRRVVRAKTILLLSMGMSVSAVARAVGRQRQSIRKWAWRFIGERLKGLDDRARSGRPARFSPGSSYASNQVGL